MQTAAQIGKAPATSRACRGHDGTRFVPVFTGEGHWTYYWMSLPQAWFWRSRNSVEKGELVSGSVGGCFVCGVQEALERETLFEDARHYSKDGHRVLR